MDPMGIYPDWLSHNKYKYKSGNWRISLDTKNIISSVPHGFWYLGLQDQTVGDANAAEPKPGIDRSHMLWFFSERLTR